jgi:hypothetical protein
MPFTNFGASAAHSSLAASIASSRATSSGTSSRSRTVTPDSSVAGLSPPPEAVSPFTPGSVSVTDISTALGTCTSEGCSST